MELKWTEQEFVWVEDNLTTLRNSTAVTMEFRDKTYQLYNKINNTNKRPTSCGRCWNNTKQQVIQYYEKIRNAFA